MRLPFPENQPTHRRSTQEQQAMTRRMAAVVATT